MVIVTTEQLVQSIKLTDGEFIGTSGVSDDQLTALVKEATLYVDGFGNMPQDIKDIAIKLYACHLVSLGNGESITSMKVGQIMLEQDDNSKAYDQFLARFNDLISQYSMNGEVIFDAGGEFLDRPIDLRSYPYHYY